ncbi:hypothetical protein F5Y19DRAFT_476183 [Xylariaceae sp. FL1651]|nr:hypothetical protein F5Y19DRAFT_476183 [Xylariaceae sp. FL1651]
MSEPQTDSRPAWARIPFPSGWSSDRIQALTTGDFSQVPDEERKRLWATNRKLTFSPEYTKIKELNAALLQANERPSTPPAYVPSGWATNQARGFNLDLIAKLSAKEYRLRAAGKTADDVRRAQKQYRLPTHAPSFIPAGWTTEQAMCPNFELLSRLSKHVNQQDFTKSMQARNEANQSLLASTQAPQKVDAAPSPLVQTLQRAGFPPWGFVVVRTYYRSESHWEQFHQKLEAMCDEQLNGKTWDGLEKIRESLEFKMIEDPRLQDLIIYFHIAKTMGAVATGLDISVLLVGNAEVVDSVLNDGANNSGVPYVTAIDVTDW